MGFLDNLFGKREKETRVMDISEAEELIQKRKLEVSKKLEREVSGKFSEIKHLILEAGRELDTFSKRDIEAEEGHKRLRKIVTTSKKSMVNQMNSLLPKLQPPEERDIESVRNYCLNANNILEREVSSFGKNIRISGLVLKDEVKNLGNYIQELGKTFKLLQEMFSKSGFDDFENASAKIGDLKNSLNDEKNLAKNKEQLEKTIKELGKSAAEKEREIAEMEISDGAKGLEKNRARLSGLVNERKALKEKLINLLASVDRPMKKFQGLVESGRFVLNEREKNMLNQYLSNPLLAEKQDLRGEILKSLLINMENCIKDGAIILKDKERGKRLAALQRLIEYDFYSEIFWKSNEIASELNSIEKEMENNAFQSKISSLERNLREINVKAGDAKSEAETVGRKLSLLKDYVGRKKSLAENSISKISGEKVLLRA
ncbi:MAG: hypothetical protein ABID38_02515 [Candidatus Diapherotrites archaeon]